MLKTERRLFVPEVVQTSAMDCGPAALKALLEGYGLSISYGRLREACQTSVNGTSINALEDLAGQLGLTVEQVMVPTDHLLLAEAQTLPAIVVVRLPNGLTHFIVAWSQIGDWVQVMDPGVGRQWVSRQNFLGRLFIHRFPVPRAAWREWASSADFIAPFRKRLDLLRVKPPRAAALVTEALADADWLSIATLDAATRLTTALVNARAIEPGDEASRLVAQLFQSNRDLATPRTIPDQYWSVARLPAQPEALLLRGAVLVRALGRSSEPLERAPDAPYTLSPEQTAALTEPSPQPEHAVWRALREEGWQVPAVILAALGLASAGMTVQAMLLRGVLWLGPSLPRVEQRWVAAGVTVAFLLILFVLEVALSTTIQRLGRRLEMRLRMAFLEKIPRLSDHYFHSRLMSDMAQRAHDLRSLRALPTLGVNLARTLFEMLLTMSAIIWLEPRSAILAILSTLAFIALALLSRPALDERDLRLRSHLGALSRFYLDALLGLTPLRAHNAGRAFRREHEGLLVEWGAAGLAFARATLLIQNLGAVLYSISAIWILFDFLARGGEAGAVLLLFYWTLNLPVLGQTLVETLHRYPMMRNHIVRMLELISAPDETEAPLPSDVAPTSLTTRSTGLQLTLRQVKVVAGGNIVLDNINLLVRPGEHIAIVGPSGAGKSSLLGVFLGWHRPAAGLCLVDEVLLDPHRLGELRQVIAWVDPAVQLWNRTLLENLNYGNEARGPAPVNVALEEAELFEVFARMENGLHTLLGENGGLVSGGEGQRVRLGRALNRVGVRLVLLDEPFRGLDRTRRRELLARARRYWQDVTLLCATHDVGETQAFERVWVMEGGQIVEDDHPATLLARPNSRYRALLEAEDAVRVGLWQSAEWRRWRMQEGHLDEAGH